MKNAEEGLPFDCVLSPVGRTAAVWRNDATSKKSDSRSTRLYAGPRPSAHMKSPVASRRVLVICDPQAGSRRPRGSHADSRSLWSDLRHKPVRIFSNRLTRQNGILRNVIGRLKLDRRVVRIKRHGLACVVHDLLKGFNLIRPDLVGFPIFV